MLELVNVIHHCLSNFHCNYPFGVGKSFKLESSSTYIQFWMAMMKVCSCSIWWSRHISNVDQPTHWCAHIVAVPTQCCNRAVRVWVDLTKLNDQVTKERLTTWPRNFSNKVIPISVAVVISGQLTCVLKKTFDIFMEEWWNEELVKFSRAACETCTWDGCNDFIRVFDNMLFKKFHGNKTKKDQQRLLPCLEDLLPTTGYNFFCPLQTHSMTLQFSLMQGFPIRLQQCVINLDKPVH